jgi:hypothetical protein
MSHRLSLSALPLIILLAVPLEGQAPKAWAHPFRSCTGSIPSVLGVE